MSARDKFKNSNMLGLNNESGAETITDVIRQNLEEQPLKAKKTPSKAAAKKRAPGRPRKFAKNETTVVLGIRVKQEEALFLEEYGGKFGGKTGYVTHLIRQEMDRVWQLKILD